MHPPRRSGVRHIERDADAVVAATSSVAASGGLELLAARAFLRSEAAPPPNRRADAAPYGPRGIRLRRPRTWAGRTEAGCLRLCPGAVTLCETRELQLQVHTGEVGGSSSGLGAERVTGRGHGGVRISWLHAAQKPTARGPQRQQTERDAAGYSIGAESGRRGRGESMCRARQCAQRGGRHVGAFTPVGTGVNQRLQKRALLAQGENARLACVLSGALVAAVRLPEDAGTVVASSARFRRSRRELAARARRGRHRRR